MSETKTFAGRPIRGDISHYGSTPEAQRPISELIVAIDGVFAFPEVESIKWDQYTPYFNDGDACEFDVREPRFRITGVDDEAGDYEDGYLTGWDIRSGNELGPEKYGEEVRYPQVSPALAAAIGKCTDALSGGAHEVDLRKHFGDPAEVIATRDGFNVEFYDHD